MSATMTGGKTGTASASTSCVVTSVSAEAGDTIVLYVHLSIVAGALSATPDWGGTPFSNNPIDQLTGLADGETYIFFLPEVSVGTHDVTIPFSIALNAAAAVEVWRGIKQTPQDQLTSTNGSSTSPSSGATAATTQAAELVLGVVGTNGPSGDTAGTWSNSFTASQRAGTTGGIAGNNRTVATGYKIVAATGAQTAAKTGITSRSWTAGVVTFKLADDVVIALGTPSLLATAPALATTPAAVTLALGSPSVAVTAPAMTTTPVTGVALGTPAHAVTAPALSVTKAAASIALGTAALALTAPALAVGAAATLSLGSPSMSLTAPALDGIISYMGTEANGVLDPPATLTDGAASIAQSRGIRSFGLPYFAMWMQNPGAFTEFGGGENTLLLVAALNAMPTQIASPDEPHYLASIHEIGGVEVFSLGVTPNGRLLARTYTGGTLQSAPGIVVADGVARNYNFFFAGGSTRQLSIGPLIVAQDDQTNLGDIGPYSPTGKPVRVMIFNGVEAKTLCDCTIFALGLAGENTPVLWPMTPIVGITTPGYETTSWIGEPLTLHDPPDYEGADFDLTAGFYDPRPFYAPAVGDFPTDAPSQAFRRVLNTQYTPRRIVTPDYRLVGAS